LTPSERLAAARVGRLATVTPAGRPHVVACCFAVVEGGDIVSVVDAKPKSTLALRRLANIRSNPAVSLLVDEYDDADWARLWWVRVDGDATVVDDGPVRDSAVAALAAKYGQYRTTPPPGPAIVIVPRTWRSWP
jgi:PPOX class probable F420-dependent enzyme